MAINLHSTAEQSTSERRTNRIVNRLACGAVVAFLLIVSMHCDGEQRKHANCAGDGDKIKRVFLFCTCGIEGRLVFVVVIFYSLLLLLQQPNRGL